MSDALARLELVKVHGFTHVPRASAKRDENRWIVCDSLQPLVQPSIGIVNVRVGTPQRLIPLNQEIEGVHRRVGRQIHRSPVISRVGRWENDPLITGLTNASLERAKQTEGFIENSPD